MESRRENAEALLNSRSALAAGAPHNPRPQEAAEGGCGVLGFASSVPIPGRHVITASRQMHNRGNGKGGGIAAAGLDPAQMGVPEDVLRTHYLIQVAYLEEGARAEVERECLTGRFDVAHAGAAPTVEDPRAVAGLEVRPPDVVRYFCRVKPEALARFAEENGLRHLPARQVEDEYVYQNTFRLNQRYYASLGEKRAFVLCHGRDLLIFKIVGYAEEAAAYYRLEDLTAHVWIAHQRYPTKGRVWHPGGAHPFIGVNEALVHNGDFANYHRVTEYLRQRNIVPLFLTDTEVSALLFDLWDRVYQYPLEVLLEALAPTTDRDFDTLPKEKQALYRAIQQTHLHGSPDGPWFFIIARSHPDADKCQLLGVTDTSMLRPQVFALYESAPEEGGGDGQVQIGLIASERQAINACLRSIAGEDGRFQALADRYWVARGGSYTDGGAFAFTVSGTGHRRTLACADKFGTPVAVPLAGERASSPSASPDLPAAPHGEAGAREWSVRASRWIANNGLADIERGLEAVGRAARASGETLEGFIAGLTVLRDSRFPRGGAKRSALLSLLDRVLYETFRSVPALDEGGSGKLLRVGVGCSARLRVPAPREDALIVDAQGFPPEGEDSAARLICRAFEAGWRHFIAFDWRGGRFAGCGLGPGSDSVRLEIYGDPGDYLASGLDGATMTVHGDAQDQAGQIMKSGTLVVHGEVGQTFLYGAKGGEVFVLGSAAGRPLINAVGRPRVVINGTCLDYLAESFMAGDPLAGGGFVILNGVHFDEEGGLHEMETPYPGGNLFSLASGGAIYLRDPRGKLDEDQLNGGCFAPLSDADWKLIRPFLERNEALFGIRVEDLLKVDGTPRPPSAVYRKVQAMSLEALH